LKFNFFKFLSLISVFFMLISGQKKFTISQKLVNFGEREISQKFP
jgi:hypothetical protein